MNIILSYLVSDWTTGKYIENALRKSTNIDIYDFKNTPYWGDLRNKSPFYFPKGFPVSIKNVINKNNKNYDLVIEVTSAGQYHLTGYKGIKIPKVLWALDVYRYDQRKFMLWIKNDFDVIFSAHKNYIDIFKPVKSCWLPYACDPEVHKKYDLPKKYDVVFIGKLDPAIYQERIKLLEAIGKRFNLKIFSNIYGEEMAKIYSQAKIVFNKSCDGEINMRIFEALSCGSLLVTDKLNENTGLEELFKDEKHLVLYKDMEELLEKIDYYLRNDEEREKIAMSGQKEVQEKHTYENRVNSMLSYVNAYGKVK